MNSLKCLLLLIVTLCLPLQARALSGDAIEGKVLEEGTHKPIPEAIIVVRWSGHLASFAHGKTVCYHALSALTDENGVYHIPAWKKKITEVWQKNVRPETVIITVHKPGYEEYRPPGYVRTEAFKQNIRYLKPFTGGREERLAHLKRVDESTRCNVESEQQKIRYPLIKALYEEAKAIAVTKQDIRTVNSLLYMVESMNLGEEKAFQNMSERRKAENE